MGVRVVDVTIPVSNDIIQGEYKAYVNYGLPTQTLLGAGNGGAEIDVEREIKVIEFDGAYGPTLDSDNVPLVRYTRLIGKVKLEQLYLKYFHRKKISDCESDGAWESNNWGLDGGTYAAETTIVNSGSQSAKCSIASGQTGHGIHEVFSEVKNLTIFDNSETSAAGDYIGFAVYITSAMLTILGTDSIQLRIHMDEEDTETNYYYYDVEASALTADQWNTFKIAKSAFSTQGSGDWSAVTGISFEIPDESNNDIEFYVDSIDLIQNQTNSAIVPLNAGGFDYTDQTTYRKISPELEITEDDYLDNVTLIGQKMDGKKWKVVIKNCLNDGEINLAFEEFKEVINSTTFTGHYKRGAGTTAPIEIYEYVA
jgi:hypothetical protein